MDDRVLLAALSKLHEREALPASQFTVAQRAVLDQFVRQTGAVRCQRLRILVKLATNNASKLAGDNASTCPLQKELQAES